MYLSRTMEPHLENTEEQPKVEYKFQEHKETPIVTRNTSIMDGISYSSTIDLGASRAKAELALIKLFLIHQLTSSPVYSVAINNKFRIILPYTR